MRLAGIVVGAIIAAGIASAWPAGAPAARPAHGRPPPAPSLYTAKEGDFSVAFPGTPKTGLHMLLGGKERLYMDNEGDRLFMVTASTFLFGARTDPQGYDRRLKRFADNAGAILVSSRRLTWGGDSGCEGVFTTPQGNLVLVRMVVHDKRLYQAVFWGRGGIADPDAAEGRRFLDSFRLTDR